MKTIAYLIDSDDNVVASIATELKNRTRVKFAYNICVESLDANRVYNLVNARTARLSRAKKYTYHALAVFTKEINPGEFYIY